MSTTRLVGPRFQNIGCLLAGFALLLVSAPALAQSPAEVSGVGFSDASTLGWSATPDADLYQLYRGALGAEAAACHGFRIESTSFSTPAMPEPDQGFYYLVTAESLVDGEGSPGTGSEGAPRALAGSCGAVMRTHVLDRLGYGWGEWSESRLHAIGLDAYIAEQLDPASVDESDNMVLNDALDALDPPASIIELIQRQIISGVYARRQLEQAFAMFWANHFNTYWGKLAMIFQGVFPPCQGGAPPPQCDPAYPTQAYLAATALQQAEIEAFRRLGFTGSFREILEASAKSPAMILYLDTYTSRAGNPNENYPRELLELYSMGVAGGYTQADVEELSRVFTGWTICKKTLANADDPLAQCIDNYWEETPVGKWAPVFIAGFHDCTQKTLFQDTPHESTIPQNCGSDLLESVNDVGLALDAIVAHPSTAEFISRKILERFVTDQPTQAMVDAVVAVWNDPTHPQGVGDLRAVLEAALTLGAFLDPDGVGSKIKTPLEHLISAIRGTRGRTDGVTEVLNFLVLAQHIPFYDTEPTGWPERGDAWIGTNNYLERQNFGASLLGSSHPFFGAEPIDLLNDNGVSTAPGNAEAIVDFFADVFFGGALTPSERQTAIDYLNTDAFGNPGPYDDLRIRETVALLLGYPHFQEQ